MNTTTTTPIVDDLARLMGSLMNGESLPAHPSEEFERIERLIRSFHANGTTDDQARLGLLALGLVIDACRAKIAADTVLRNFGAGSM